MEFNWPSFVNYDNSESMTNPYPDFSGVHTTIDHDGNEMDLELDPYTQPELRHRSHTLYSTNHHAGLQLNISRMEVYPTNFLNPEQSTPEGYDYGWFSASSLSGANYMEGLGSARNTGMLYGEWQETVFNTMNLDNNNNALHSTILPHSSFINSNTHAVHGSHSTIFMGTPDYGHADIQAQTPNFGFNLNPARNPAPAIRTSAMPNDIPLPTPPITTTATPSTVVDDGHNYGHGHDAGFNYDPNHDTPAPKLPEQEASASASRCREKTQERVYRVSYNSHACHRYTCHPCRISTDVKRDFARHLDTGKHKRKTRQEEQEKDTAWHERGRGRGRKA